MGHTLDQVFNFAIRWANEKHHEYLNLELIFLGLLEDKLVHEVLSLCGVKVEDLRLDLTEFLNDQSNFSVLDQSEIETLSKAQFADNNIRQIAKNSGIFYQPELTMALQRVLQRGRHAHSILRKKKYSRHSPFGGHFW